MRRSGLLLRWLRRLLRWQRLMRLWRVPSARAGRTRLANWRCTRLSCCLLWAIWVNMLLSRRRRITLNLCEPMVIVERRWRSRLLLRSGA